MANIKTVYLSTALSDDIFDEIVKQCRSFKPTFSGVGFDRNIGVGLSDHMDVRGISLFPIPSYPKYQKLFQESRRFSQKGFSAIVASLTNLPVVKEFSYNRFVKKSVKKFIGSEDKIAVVVSGMYRSLLRPARWIKKKYPSVVCTVVPDVPELMSVYRKDYSAVRRLLNRLDAAAGKKIRNCSDGYVFLSPYMDRAVNPGHKPYIIVDGLCENSHTEIETKHEGKPFVMYAGKISRTFGTDRLVKAFLTAGITDCELRLYGDGDYADELRKVALTNDNIIYGGLVPHDRILQLEQQACLLVEPRPSDGEIVKMSFPSKIIEYMLSGTPVLTTNLPCFSADYKKYQFRIEDESVKGIADALKSVLSLDADELSERGFAARTFILNNKTVELQCGKIADFIEGLMEDKNRS